MPGSGSGGGRVCDRCLRTLHQKKPADQHINVNVLGGLSIGKVPDWASDTPDQASPQRHQRSSFATNETEPTGPALALENMAKAFSEFGKQLDTTAYGVGYAQDAADARRRVFRELEKMEALRQEERFDVRYRIVSDPSNVDIFFSLPECAIPLWVQLVLLGYI
ncbi:hypothetical protein Acr_05g0007860 [Actinidia rufa]|uniref:Uncharacterized protein n=1 Tax=Actinidia rufa TaxID=165716 RepID=A0A7J0ENJ2_9ERIC|nr:hypothetical protein Acr_05g0007860 [Actinidia rufa]